MSWRYLETSVLPRYFCMYSFDDLTESQNFPKYFLNFGLHTAKKQSIINFNIYCSKSYASIVLRDSDVSFLGEE